MIVVQEIRGVWLSKLLQRDAERDAPPKSRPRGFSEVAQFGGVTPDARPAPLDRPPPEWSEPYTGAAAQPFPGTGPQGHRARMRTKLLERGPNSLADYELLEMLLFFAQPRGDTKPLSKAVINRFGSFARVLAAPQRELFETPGLGPHSVAAIKLVQASAVRLARAEVMDRPVVNNWDRLMEYLGAVLSGRRPSSFVCSSSTTAIV